jgi:hypothetical protein
MELPSRFFETKIVKDEKGDDITPFDGRYHSDDHVPWEEKQEYK